MTTTTTRRTFVRAAAALPLGALPAATATASPATAPAPLLADRLAFLARHLPFALGLDATYAVEGNRCVLAGDGWRLSAARTDGGLDLRMDGVSDFDLQFVALGVADLLRALAPPDAVRGDPYPAEDNVLALPRASSI